MTEHTTDATGDTIGRQDLAASPDGTPTHDEAAPGEGTTSSPEGSGTTSPATVDEPASAPGSDDPAGEVPVAETSVAETSAVDPAADVDPSADVLRPEQPEVAAAGLGSAVTEPAAAAGIEPAEQAAPQEPAQPQEPAERAQPAEPQEPAQPQEPADPAPSEQSEQSEQSEPDEQPPAPEQAVATEGPDTGEQPVPDEPPGAEQAPSTTDAAPVAATGAPAPGPRPTPRPTPRPVPRPIPRAAAAPAQGAGAPVAPVAPPQDAAEAAHATTFGRVDDAGTVYVREGAGERAVGQFPGASADEALALYVRRYLDLHAKVVLFEARLASADLATKEIDQTLTRLTEELVEPAAVGDLDGLRTRLDALRSLAAERRAAADAERAAAKEAAVAARTLLVEQAEKIAGTDPERIQWRPAGEQLRELLDQWKDAQRNGPRIDRPTEESLWKRFSHARTTFDRERRHFFAELESRNAAARSAKEALVAQAERLATSTDWGVTAGAYRDLMAQWKASGRASRKEDDALWARFRAAQDAFFAARDAASAETDAEFTSNLAVKEGLLVEAEKILPIRDLATAKAALRSIQDRWDAAGKVPRGDLQRVEARLRAVENAVRDADQSAWTRGNPETRARAEGAAAQLEAAIAGLEADLAKARAQGDQRRIADAQTALDARRAWLEQVLRAAQGS